MPCRRSRVRVPSPAPDFLWTSRRRGRGVPLSPAVFRPRGAPWRRSQVVRQRSAKPPSRVRLPSPPPTTSLHLAISGRARPRTELPNRQNCRHSADETRRHAAGWAHTRHHPWAFHFKSTAPALPRRGSTSSVSTSCAKRKSSLLYGVGEDAALVVDRLVGATPQRSPACEHQPGNKRCRLLLQRRNGVRVGVEGDGDGRVTEALRDDLGMDAGSPRQQARAHSI